MAPLSSSYHQLLQGAGNRIQDVVQRLVILTRPRGEIYCRELGRYLPGLRLPAAGGRIPIKTIFPIKKCSFLDAKFWRFKLGI